MKRIGILLLALFSLFPGCKHAQTPGNASIHDMLTHIQNAIGSKEEFTNADEDFIRTNLGSPQYLSEGVVCFDSGSMTREIGIFQLSDRSKAKEFKETLKSYLEREKEALRALSALYPAEELERRLALFENATVGAEGMLVYYFVLDSEQTQKALTILTGRQGTRKTGALSCFNWIYFLNSSSQMRS